MKDIYTQDIKDLIKLATTELNLKEMCDETKRQQLEEAMIEYAACVLNLPDGEALEDWVINLFVAGKDLLSGNISEYLPDDMMVVPTKDNEIIVDLLAECPDDLWKDILNRHYTEAEQEEMARPIKEHIQSLINGTLTPPKEETE